jgi:hypothetical protein
MKKNKLFWMMAMLAMALMVAMPSCSSDNGGDEPYEEEPGPDPEPTDPSDHESLKGSNYHVFYMDAVNSAALGNKIVQELWPNEVDRFFYNWLIEGTSNLTYNTNDAASGPNAYGQPDGWLSLTVSNGGWSGAAFAATADFTEVYNDKENYYFHLALKSPTNQPNAGQEIIFHSQGTEVGLYFGPETSGPIWNGQWYANYPHDGEWHHFDVPVSLLVERGWLWYSPYELVNMIVVTSGGVEGTELNLDAVFFYKK